MLDYKDLISLPLLTTVSADDIAKLSGQNRVKGIHPINHRDFKGVVILCTIGGQSYQNEWLDAGQTKLKYYLEGRTDKRTGSKTYNPNITTNRSIIESKAGHPIVVFLRDKKGQPFRYEGNFIYNRIVKEPTGDMYFELTKEQPDDFFESFFDGDEQSSVVEGKRVLRQHYVRERDSRVIKDAILAAKRKYGKVECEVCGFNFKTQYGNRGEDFIEGHHKKPLSELTEEAVETRVEDIVLLCSNCHRMIHRRKPWLSVEELQRLLNAEER